MGLEDDIKEFADSEAKLVDTVSNRVIRELRQVVKRYEALFDKALRAQDFEKDTVARLADAQALTGRLEDFLEDAGLERAVGLYRGAHSRLVAKQLEYFGQVAKTPTALTSATDEALTILMNENTKVLFEEVDAKLIRPLNTALIQSTFGSEDTAQIVTNVQAASDDLSIAQTERLIGDTYNRFNRAVRTEVAKDLEMDVVIYSGPLDKKTSPQCQFLLTEARHGAPGVWLKSEFTASLHPDLREDPIVAGGHYNCRHGVYYMTRESAEEQLGASF